MTALPPDGLYQIIFTDQQFLTAPEPRPGAPLMLLPPDGGLTQTWELRSDGNGSHTIGVPDAREQVSYEGDPDMHELAVLLPQPRIWNLIPGKEPGTYAIGVPDAELRLGMSLLRIYPPRVALAPDFGEKFQAWRFRPVA
ncbi:hypothetical protein [Streptomyces phaeofaciens]|uniref:hypothetical protein n=1 Tax=Streptomyces phaeofaciens TaxID=68254 RepID=UPI0036D00CCE